jgi:uncharacterized membrane protein YeaQ/YmgE (transglycosylase-associated protein family)
MPEILWFLLIGLVAGWIAGQIMKSALGLVGDLVVGVVGALLGGMLFRFAGLGPTNLIGQIVAATVGAILFIVLLRFIKKKT